MSASLVQCSGRCSLSSAWSTSRRSNVELLHVPSDKNPSHQVTGTNLNVKPLSLEACLEASRQSSKCRANAPSLNFNPQLRIITSGNLGSSGLNPNVTTPNTTREAQTHPQRNLKDLLSKSLSLSRHGSQPGLWASHGFSTLHILDLVPRSRVSGGLIEVSSPNDVSIYHQFSIL